MRADELGAAVAFAERLADASRAIIRDALGRSRTFVAKADKSPVTEIDRRVEREIRRLVAAHYPAHGILGEEFGSAGLDEEHVWVIDPIDGTKAFIGGIPTYGTLIALAHRGTPILGIIDHPVTGERWVGVDGSPTLLNGVPMRARFCDSLAGTILTTSSPEPFQGVERHAFDRLRAAVGWCIYGGGCYGYGRLAGGTIDVGIESDHDPWDYCALVPVIRNAGGAISDWEGNPLTIRSGKRFVAAGDPRRHAEVLDILSGIGAAAS